MRKNYLKVLSLFSAMLFGIVANAQFSEGFESGIPGTWTVIDNDGQGEIWSSTTAAFQTGAQSVSVHWESAAHDDYLISPQINVQEGISDRVHFYIGGTGTTFPESYEIKISTTTPTVGAFTSTLLSGITTKDAESGDWDEIIYDLPSSYNGQSIYLAVVATSTNEFYIYLDNFTVEGTPSCPAPTALNAFNLTGFSADIAWTEAGAATSWQVEYGTSGFTQGTGTLSVESNDTINLSTLTPETAYDFYVRAICGPGDTSLWVGPFAFTTTPSCPAPTALAMAGQTATTTDLSWTEAGAAPSWQVEYGSAGFTQGTGTMSLESNDTTTVTTILNTDYEFYVRAICGPGDTSTWAGPFAFHTGYCVPTTTYTGDYISGITTSGAVQDISYSATSQPAGSYDDLTATDTLIAFQGQSFTGTETYVGGTSDLKIWVDTNMNFIFDASELIVAQNAASPHSLSFSIPASYPIGAYRMRVRGMYDFGGSSLATLDPCSNVDYGSTVDFVLKVVTPPACLPITGLTLDNIYSDSAEISWTAGGVEIAWNLEWGTPGFTPGTGAGLGATTIPTTTYMVTGLSPNTTYEVYVQANCGGSTAAWVGPLSFTTNCTATNVPYVQDFESAAVPDMPSCTSIENAGTGNDWKTTSTTNSGFNSIVLDYPYNFSNPANAWFYTQGINLIAGTDYQISYEYGDLSYVEKLKIAYGTAPTSAAMTNVLADHTTSGTSTLATNTAYFTAPTTGVYYFGFNAHSDANMNQLYVDNIVVDLAPACLPITALQVDSTAQDSISISWTAGGIETSWNIEWGAPGFTPGTGTQIGGTTSGTTVYHITGLNASSTYDIYVQSDCSGGDLGSWILIQGNTDCAPISTLPWTENFDAMASVGSGLFPLCWIDENGEWYSANNTYVGTDISSPNNISVDYDSDDYIWTPEFNLDSGVIYSFSFKWIGDGDDGWDGSVYVSPSQSSTDAVQIGTNFIVNTEVSPGTIQKETYCFTPDSSGVYSFGIYVSSNFSPWTLSFDDFSLRIPSANAGVDGATTICQTAGNVDLNAIITINDTTGNWTFAPNPTAIVSDTLFNPSSIAAGTQNVYYVVGGCVPDTVIAAVTIYPPSSAGTDGTDTTCNYGFYNLYNALSGTADLGGQWYDPASQPVNGSSVNFNGNIPASYNYIYIASNGVCPADTAIVEIVLTQCAGVDEYSLQGFNFYPNPTNGVVNIQYAGNGEDVKIDIIDTKGAVVWTKQVQFTDGTTQKIDLTQFENGTYFINMRSKNGAKVMKVVKN